MDASALRCPSCGAAVRPPSRFAREAACGFCGTVLRLDPSRVRSARYKEAFAEWETPGPALEVGGTRWVLGERIGRGTVADVYRATRPRFPSERAVVKLLRVGGDLPVAAREWATTSALAVSDAPGAPAYTRRIPEPIVCGTVSAGGWSGHHAAVYRATPGFRLSLAAVRARPPARLAQASLWVWRRVLEVLTFLHRAGYAHGAVAPEHVLVQDGEHGARLVGFGNAARIGSARLTVPLSPPGLFPDEGPIGPRGDVVASARTVQWLLTGAATTPPDVPPPYARVLRAAAGGELDDAWALREELGAVARAAYGRPAFLPLSTPEVSHG